MTVAKLKALIFDVDGTLSDTERDGHLVAFNLAFADAGLDWYWSDSLYTDLLNVTGGKERIGYYLDHYHASFKHPEDLQGFITDLHQNKTRHYIHLLENGDIPLRVGVKRLLEEALASQLRLAIATTTSLQNVKVLLTLTLGVESFEWFEIIAAGDIVTAKKPAGDIYHYVLEKMDLLPTECIALEDSHNGLVSAQQAQIATVITVNSYTEKQNFNGAEIVLSDLGEPDIPFQLLTGNSNGFKYVDVSMLQSLFGHSRMI